jgi:argininosuccinate lyase
MPQKKNPDVAELARGKAGRLIGHVVALLATLKGLPLAYDRDLQEDKEPVFDAVETLTTVLPALTGTVATARVRADRLEAAAPAGFSLATDVAEFLVRKGIPFRDAHEAVGHLVVWCLANDVGLEGVSDADLAAVSEHLTPDVRAVLSVPGAMASRSAPGGTAPARVREQLAAVRAQLERDRVWAGSN